MKARDFLITDHTELACLAVLHKACVCAAVDFIDLGLGIQQFGADGCDQLFALTGGTGAALAGLVCSTTCSVEWGVLLLLPPVG